VKKALLAIAIIVASAGILLLGRMLIRQRRINAGISNILIGMTESQVVELLGKPAELRPCSQIPKVSSCKEEYVYYPPFELVSYWTVSFDQQGKVMDKFHWQSP
jgi:hypothetical protein